MTKSNSFSAALFSLVLAAGCAHAQVAKYCSNALVANSAFQQVASNGTSSVVSYYLQLQNQDPSRRQIISLVRPPATIGPFTSVQVSATPLTLNPNEQQKLLVYKINVSNASGQGAPDAKDVARQFNFVCNFRQL